MDRSRLDEVIDGLYRQRSIWARLPIGEKRRHLAQLVRRQKHDCRYIILFQQRLNPKERVGVTIVKGHHDCPAR